MRFTQTIFSEFEKRWPVSCFCWLFLFLNQNLKYNTNMKLVKYIVLLLAIGLLLAASSARADLFQFTSDHTSDGAGSAPFGTVLLTDNGTGGVDVTVTLASGFQFVRTGSGDFMNFLFDDANINLTDITNIQASGQTMAATGSTTPTLHADGTGTWMWGVFSTTQPTGGGSGFNGPITFTVTNTTLADMEVGHAVVGFGTELFVADIIAPNGSTGPVDVNTPPVVPDSGAAATLLGLGLAGLAAFRTKFRKA
jgi:VPDSG-CTERM motif